MSNATFTTDVLSAALAAAATSMDGSTEAQERTFEDSLEEALTQTGVGVIRQKSIKLDSWEGRLGSVDLTVEDGDRLIPLELKWGELTACSWDTVKLATTLAEGKASSAYLVAGAPKKAWINGDPGVDLFNPGVRQLEPLLDLYAEWFDFWRRDVKNYPKALASAWRVVADPASGGVEVSIGGVDHEIRAVEIELPVGVEILPVAYAPVLANWKRR